MDAAGAETWDEIYQVIRDGACPWSADDILAHVVGTGGPPTRAVCGRTPIRALSVEEDGGHLRVELELMKGGKDDRSNLAELLRLLADHVGTGVSWEDAAVNARVDFLRHQERAGRRRKDTGALGKACGLWLACLCRELGEDRKTFGWALRELKARLVALEMGGFLYSADAEKGDQYWRNLRDQAEKNILAGRDLG